MFGSSSVSDPDPGGSGFKSLVLIRIRNPDPDPAIEIELLKTVEGCTDRVGTSKHSFAGGWGGGCEVCVFVCPIS